MKKYICPLCKKTFNIKMREILVCQCKSSIKTAGALYLCIDDNEPFYIILFLNINKTSFEHKYNIILELDTILSPQEIEKFDLYQIINFI